MAVTSRGLMDRWSGIIQGDEDEDDPASSLRFRRLKEEWFSDAFNFLIHLPKESHIWCSSWDLMAPLLETFCNFFKDQRHDSPLKLLWNRISQELRHCTQCICHHYQAQESYNAEYEASSVRQLIGVLRSLDEERVTQHLKDINAKIVRGEYDPVRDNTEVISVMFEVLMFPVLLDDQSLVAEFEKFIEAVDNSHELTLSGSQQYPGVYALLFFKSRRARSIGFRLAVHMGKLRGAADMEPLQPLLKRYINFLETEGLSSSIGTSRPRVQLERLPVWHGMKALLGFLEPPAFEEGILEPYPIFLSIVLNHISDDSLEFSFAVNCLRVLFEMLGCKLWLSATLSPNVMLNTLLGQCFHTRNEKSHKDIFDLFQPFLQSLEALQDGEHEKQRRHCLYFLLHQVTVSSNFSFLMRRKACQIALRIVHRGYEMNPPCPPFECAHMWGPSLVSSLKDSSLHSSLRQPAFDLIQIIVVSDVSAISSALINSHTPSIIEKSMSAKFSDEDEDQGLPFAHDFEEKDISCWNKFSAQGKVAALEYGSWMCIPMLWVEILVEIDPLVLPVSFSKAVFWVLSRLSMVEPLSNTEMVLPVRNWLTTCASEISHMFGWKVPCGSDDGGERRVSKNSVQVSTLCIPLVRTLKRLSAHYVVRMGQGEIWKQWNWEPRIGESLILLLVDPDDNTRQVARHILEQVSKTRTLACGLQFLCSQSYSLSAIFSGLRHALKLVLLDSVLLKYQTLHHLFFVLCKVLKEGITEIPNGNSGDDEKMPKFSDEGGFLRQPVVESLANDADGHSSSVVSKSWETFSCLLSVVAWPSILKCLVEGKAFIDYKIYQMTCIRLLETIPIVFERLRQFHSLSRNSSEVVENGTDFRWLLDLMDWGKSLLAVIIRYWNQTVLRLLNLLKGSCSDNSLLFIKAIEKLINSDNVSKEELCEQVSRLSVSLMNENFNKCEKTKMKSEPPLSEGLLAEKSINFFARSLPVEDADMQIRNSTSSLHIEQRDDVIVLSDNDADTEIPDSDNRYSLSNQPMSDGCTLDCGASERIVRGDFAKEFPGIDTSVDLSNFVDETGAPDFAHSVSKELQSDARKGAQGPVSVSKPKAVKIARKKTNYNSCVNDSSTSQHIPKLQNASDKIVSSKSSESFLSGRKKSLDKKVITENRDQQDFKKVAKTTNTVGVLDVDDDPLELAIKSAGRPQEYMSKVNSCGPKRQVIQLNIPVNNRYSNLYRLDSRPNRYKPPKLDDWYRPILELDYLALVGLAAPSEEENKTVRHLKEIPVCFQSPDEYISIFRPLVLEEFKAQLQSSFMETSSSEMCCGSLSVLSVERVDDFHIVRGVYDDIDSIGSKSCSENDLILLTRKQLQNDSHDVHVVGKVDRRENDYKRRSSVLVIRFYLQNGFSRLNRARKLLLERSKWFISRLLSISPQLREFQAMSSIKSIPLLPVILNPINHPSGHSECREKYLHKLPHPLQKVLESAYNDNQVRAISAGIGPKDLKADFDLSLIQGPPGTGKTRTIIAIVSALLASSQIRDKKRQYGSINADTTSCTNIKQRMSQSAAIARAWQDAALARQFNHNEGKNEKLLGSCTRGRVLICAQSNAAVDELVSRISSEGLYGSDGMIYKPYLVRVGNARTVHPNSLPYFIDTLVANRLAQEINVCGTSNDSSGDLTVLRSKLERLVHRIKIYESKRANITDGNSGSKDWLEGEEVKEMSDAEIGAMLRKLYSDKKEVYQELAAAQVREKKTTEESRAVKHKLRKSILREAEIVVTTLNGCGGDLYAVCYETVSNHKFDSSVEDTLFDAVVIDEAAQALEPATLIPLQLLKSKGTKCIMVGDPKQLPATVISNVASKYLYQCSMFERLQRAGHPVILLNKQYRMHPEIARFPSLHFYNGKLLNGENMSTKKVPFHKIEVLGPYVFFDVVGGQELRGKNSGALSFYNECEADAAVELLRFFKQRYSSYFAGGRIGVVTPYKSQISLLRSRFSTAFGSSVTTEMEFNTVDGFQGREVDILVLSTVRAEEQSSVEHRFRSEKIGFVADVRRMNVALTRAKLSLWIFGNARTLMANKNWEALISDAAKRNLVIPIKKPYDSIFKCVRNNNRSLEGSDHHSGQQNHAEVFVEVGWRAEQQKKSANNSYERKTCRDAITLKNIIGGEENAFRSVEADKANRAKGKSEHGLSAETDPVSAVLDSEVTKRGKGVKSTIAEKTTGNKSGGKISSKKQLNVGNSNMGGGKDHDLCQFEQMTQDIDNQGHSKSVESSGDAELCRHDKTDIANDCRERFSERDGNDKARASNRLGNPEIAITKRKQQRDAVDALLSSALVSSKKSGNYVKSVPVKRSISPTCNSGRSIKPAKSRKG